jgi:hypothetical protein
VGKGGSFDYPVGQVSRFEVTIDEGGFAFGHHSAASYHRKHDFGEFLFHGFYGICKIRETSL